MLVTARQFELKKFDSMGASGLCSRIPPESKEGEFLRDLSNCAIRIVCSGYRDTAYRECSVCVIFAGALVGRKAPLVVGRGVRSQRAGMPRAPFKLSAMLLLVQIEPDSPHWFLRAMREKPRQLRQVAATEL